MNNNTKREETVLNKPQTDTLESLRKKLKCASMHELFVKLIEAGQFLTRIETGEMNLYAVPKENVEVLEDNETDELILLVKNKKTLINVTKDIEDILKIKNETNTMESLFIPIGDA